MTEDTETLLLTLLKGVRSEQAEQRTLLLRLVDDVRCMSEDMRNMEQRFDRRLTSVRDDLELMLKSELLAA